MSLAEKNTGSLSSRRSFLAATLGSAAGIALLPSISRNAFAAREPLFKISLAEWSLHKALFAGQLNHLDFAKTAREKFNIEAVEFVNQFFKDKAKDATYLADLNKRSADYGVKNVLIMIDGEGELGDIDPTKRKQAVENHHKWVDAAKTLGCHSIRVNASTQADYDEGIKLAADGLRSLSEYAAKVQINVIVENHGGNSSNGKWLSSVMKTVNLPNCGTLPDFGNFWVKASHSEPRDYDMYQGTAELMPYAKGVSAKSYDFDAEGNEISIDFRRLMKIVMDAGYHGYVGIEYEGSKLSEEDGIKATRDLLLRIEKEMA
jgi:L-ribulose-5-phosphate 3-epimerase